MGNKMIGKAVNQFIQIASMWALVWGNAWADHKDLSFFFPFFNLI